MPLIARLAALARSDCDGFKVAQQDLPLARLLHARASEKHLDRLVEALIVSPLLPREGSDYLHLRRDWWPLWAYCQIAATTPRTARLELLPCLRPLLQHGDVVQRDLLLRGWRRITSAARLNDPIQHALRALLAAPPHSHTECHLWVAKLALLITHDWSVPQNNLVPLHSRPEVDRWLRRHAKLSQSGTRLADLVDAILALHHHPELVLSLVLASARDGAQLSSLRLSQHAFLARLGLLAPMGNGPYELAAGHRHIATLLFDNPVRGQPCGAELLHAWPSPEHLLRFAGNIYSQGRGVQGVEDLILLKGSLHATHMGDPHPLRYTHSAQLQRLCTAPARQRLKRDWELGARDTQAWPSWHLIDSCALPDFINSGTHVGGSCQHVGCYPSNRALLGRLADGSRRLLCLVRPHDGYIMARAMWRMMNGADALPVLLLSRVYVADAGLRPAAEAALLAFAERRARALDLDLAACSRSFAHTGRSPWSPRAGDLFSARCAGPDFYDELGEHQPLPDDAAVIIPGALLLCLHQGGNSWRLPAPTTDARPLPLDPTRHPTPGNQ